MTRKDTVPFFLSLLSLSRGLQFKQSWKRRSCCFAIMDSLLWSLPFIQNMVLLSLNCHDVIWCWLVRCPFACRVLLQLISLTTWFLLQFLFSTWTSFAVCCNTAIEQHIVCKKRTSQSQWLLISPGGRGTPLFFLHRDVLLDRKWFSEINFVCLCP